MIKILFICHGNICRSVGAEYILKSMAEKEGMGSVLQIDSAATTREEIGNDIYPPMKAVLEKHHILYSRHHARQMSRYDYGAYDFLIGMDAENREDMLRICGGDSQGKIYDLLEFAGRKGENVSDPWWTRDFETCYRDLDAGCRGLLKFLKQQKKKDGQ